MDDAVDAQTTRLTPDNRPERKYTTISIPTQLYKNVEAAIEGTGFRSVTEFIVFVTRETLAADQSSVVDRLKALGYIE